MGNFPLVFLFDFAIGFLRHFPIKKHNPGGIDFTLAKSNSLLLFHLWVKVVVPRNVVLLRLDGKLNEERHFTLINGKKGEEAIKVIFNGFKGDGTICSAAWVAF